MEDIISTIIDVVRAQHSATEGTDQKPFDMDDIVDMALGVMGRPDEPEEVNSMTDSIQKLVESLAPDLFPPKTFEQMDDDERAASVTNMLESRLLNGFMPRMTPADQVEEKKEEQKAFQPSPSPFSARRPQTASPAREEPQPSSPPPVQTQPSSPPPVQTQPSSTAPVQTQPSGPANTQAQSSSPANAQASDSSIDQDQYSSIMDVIQAESANSGLDPRQTAELNDIIYKNLMEVMGAQPQQVEFPFDRSQIRYGQEKTITEQLEEEKAEQERQTRREIEERKAIQARLDNRDRQASQANQANQPSQPNQSGQNSQAGQTRQPAPKVSAADLAQSLIANDEPDQLTAWDLAQNAVNKDEEQHKKEPYVPKPVEEPKSKTASQLAAEAIAKAQEEDRMKLEIEKQAEALMAEAAKRGQDPMKFALHQQEILQYMEKNSDELVSFEDYEDLSPEEKLEIERQIHIEKQIADGVDPDKVDKEVPEEYIPTELKTGPANAGPQASTDGQAESGQAAAGGTAPAMSEEMLRMLSQEVVRENSDMILAENADEDISQLEETIFQNLKKMMASGGQPMEQEDVGDLIEQAILANRENQLSAAAATENPAHGQTSSARPAATGSSGPGPAQTEKQAAAAQSQSAGVEAKEDSSDDLKGLSAVELAKAAQKAAKVEPKEERNTRSAADIAREAQEKALAAKLNPKPSAQAAEEVSIKDALDLDALIEAEMAADAAETEEADKTGKAEGSKAGEEAGEKPESDKANKTQAAIETGKAKGDAEKAEAAEAAADDTAEEADEAADERADQAGKAASEEPGESADSQIEDDAEDDEEYEYIDSDEIVLGDHTQAEVDEALENLSTLGLEGEVYERAKRMLLLELAGTEAELDAWLKEQEEGKKKKAASNTLQEETINDIDDLDEDELERELEAAMDEDFLDEDFLEDFPEEEDEEEAEAEEAEADGSEDEDSEEEESQDTEPEEEESEGEESQDDKESEEEESEDEESEDGGSEDGESEDGESVDEESEDDEVYEDGDSDLEEPDDEESDDEDYDDSEDSPDSQEGSHEKSEEAEEDSQEGPTVSEDGIVDIASIDTETEVIELVEDIEEDKAGQEPGQRTSDHKGSKSSAFSGKAGHRKKVFRRRDKTAAKDDQKGKDRFSMDKEEKAVEEKSYQVSTRKPFILKNSASFMDQFEDFIVDTQENRRISTGFKKLDGMLRYGLHKGSYFIDAQPQYLKNAFMQQIADRAAESGIDVLYISTELSRYDLMVETISRLSYEIHQGDPESAVSAMSIMTGEDGADLASLKDELNWYRGRISEHLFILDQEAVSEYAESSESVSAGDIMTDIISSIVREGAHKPVVFIDNLENIMSTEDSEDMKPLMEGLSKLAKDLGIPILMSYGYAQAESIEEMYPEEREFHESIGNMCDVYMELVYADMITEDMIPLTAEDIMEMAEEGESLLINVLLHKNRRPMKASLQIQGTPKYNFFEE